MKKQDTLNLALAQGVLLIGDTHGEKSISDASIALLSSFVNVLDTTSDFASIRLYVEKHDSLIKKVSKQLKKVKLIQVRDTRTAYHFGRFSEAMIRIKSELDNAGFDWKNTAKSRLLVKKVLENMLEDVKILKNWYQTNLLPIDEQIVDDVQKHKLHKEQMSIYVIGTVHAINIAGMTSVPVVYTSSKEDIDDASEDILLFKIINNLKFWKTYVIAWVFFVFFDKNMFWLYNSILYKRKISDYESMI